MSFHDQKSRFCALDDWFTSPQGIDVGHAFASELSHLSEFLHGETLLQLGSGGDNRWLQMLRYTHQWLATPYVNTSTTTLITSFNQLPLDRNSIDCVVLPLSMEAFSHQKNPIDEIDRILKPMGYLIFFGINPISIWGSCMRFGKLSCFGKLSGRGMSVFFIKRAMLHRGYTQCYLSSFYYIPPVRQKKWVDRLEILNELGKMIWPCPAGFYCLVVQKHQKIYPDLLIDYAMEESASSCVESLQPVFRRK